MLDFFDPDGYYFNKEGKDEFGGHYNAKGFYIPGEKNKHEFESEDDEEDDLIRQFDHAHDSDDEHVDERQEQIYREFKKRERELAGEEDDDHHHFGEASTGPNTSSRRNGRQQPNTSNGGTGTRGRPQRQ